MMGNNSGYGKCVNIMKEPEISVFKHWRLNLKSTSGLPTSILTFQFQSTSVCKIIIEFNLFTNKRFKIIHETHMCLGWGVPVTFPLRPLVYLSLVI